MACLRPLTEFKAGHPDSVLSGAQSTGRWLSSGCPHFNGWDSSENTEKHPDGLLPIGQIDRLQATVLFNMEDAPKDPLKSAEAYVTSRGSDCAVPRSLSSPPSASEIGFLGWKRSRIMWMAVWGGYSQSMPK